MHFYICLVVKLESILIIYRCKNKFRSKYNWLYRIDFSIIHFSETVPEVLYSFKQNFIYYYQLTYKNINKIKDNVIFLIHKKCILFCISLNYTGNFTVRLYYMQNKIIL